MLYDAERDLLATANVLVYFSYMKLFDFSIKS